MKIEDFEKVNKLISQIEKIKESYLQALRVLKFEVGVDDWTGCVSSFSDGSGWKVNLSGCGVGYEILHATLTVLESKHEITLFRLKDLGVLFSEDEVKLPTLDNA